MSESAELARKRAELEAAELQVAAIRRETATAETKDEKPVMRRVAFDNLPSAQQAEYALQCARGEARLID